MEVGVGSVNPVKIDATSEVFQEVFEEVQVLKKEVDSGVSDQPFGMEVVEGSKNRAKKVLEETDADFGVGIESGLVEIDGKWYNPGFITIIKENGKMGTGTSGWFECPSSVLEEIKKGKELSEVMNDMTGGKEKKKELSVFSPREKSVERDYTSMGCSWR